MKTKPLLLSQKVLTSVFYDRIPESTKVKTVALNILHTFYCTLFIAHFLCLCLHSTWFYYLD